MEKETIKTKENKYPATCVVHWPSGPVNCCERHARGLVGLSNILGSHVAVTNLEEKAECSNCRNEAGEVAPHKLKGE